MAEISFHSLKTSQQGRFAEVNSQLNFRQMIEKIKKKSTPLLFLWDLVMFKFMQLPKLSFLKGQHA